MPEASDRPILVVGCARSGTTLLQLMLHAHPRIAIPPENRYVLEAYARREDFGDLGDPDNRRKLAKWIVDRRTSKFADLGLDAKAVKRQIRNGPPTMGSALGITFRDYAARWGKPRWGDKRPAYILYLDWLLRLFPDAQIVHIIRDGRDCVSSLKRMRWWKQDSVAAIWYWVAAIRSAARARRRYRPDQYCEIRYERLVAEPRAELERLCAFLGEAFDEAMLAPNLVADEAVPERKVHHARTKQAVDTRAVSQWQGQLEPWELALIECVGRRSLRRHGYVASTGWRLPPPSRLLAYAALAARQRIGAWRRWYWDVRKRLRYGLPVAAQLTSGQLAAVEAADPLPPPPRVSA